MSYNGTKIRLEMQTAISKIIHSSKFLENTPIERVKSFNSSYDLIFWDIFKGKLNLGL